MTLSTQDRMYIEQRISNDAKSAFIAYVLWFFLGFIGAHRFYLGRVFTGLLQLCLFVAGWVLAAVAVGLILLAVLGVWWIWDAISIPMMIGSHKRKLRRRLEDEVLDDIEDSRRR